MVLSNKPDASMRRDDVRKDDVDKFLPWHGNGKFAEECLFEIGVIAYGIDGKFKLELLTSGNKKTRLELVFEAPLAIRIVQEGSLMDYWSTGFFVKKHNVFIAEKSNFLTWLNHSSSGVHSANDVKHFAVFTDDVCVEVLSRNEPMVCNLSNY